MVKIFAASLLLLNISLVKAQSFFGPGNIVKNGRFALLTAYNYNRGHWGEIGLVRGYRINYDQEPEMIAAETLYPYLSLSSEVLIGENVVICPKIGYHFVLSMVDIGISVLDYTDFNNHRYGIRPEVGISLGGMFGGYYGYNITSRQNSFNISNHNLGIRIIIGSGIFFDEEWRKKHNR